MSSLQLVVPVLAHREAALAYRQEHIHYGESYIHGSGDLIHAENYENWLKKITDAQTGAQTGWVNCSTYFAFTGDRIIGTIQIRHTLNDFLLAEGGHIGYGVRPTERRKGYAAAMLALALRKCRELGLQKVLITCDKNNIGSARTIQKNGGVLENETAGRNGKIIQRYWIDIPDSAREGKESV